VFVQAVRECLCKQDVLPELATRALGCVRMCVCEHAPSSNKGAIVCLHIFACMIGVRVSARVCVCVCVCVHAHARKHPAVVAEHPAA